MLRAIIRSRLALIEGSAPFRSEPLASGTPVFGIARRPLTSFGPRLAAHTATSRPLSCTSTCVRAATTHAHGPATVEREKPPAQNGVGLADGNKAIACLHG